MSAGFTEGPNTIVQADHLGAHAYAVVEGADGDLLAVGCLKADAQLFSAAPEIFAALQELSSAVATTAMPEASCERLFPLCLKAKAALDRARGES